ncbi:MAG: hypothetical protein K5901_03475, partial [Bacteroidales bacterium]|nr:hypothetical protein [Bacteroidales bacterium]
GPAACHRKHRRQQASGHDNQVLFHRKKVIIRFFRKKNATTAHCRFAAAKIRISSMKKNQKMPNTAEPLPDMAA